MKKAAYFSSFGLVALLVVVSGFHYVFDISQPTLLLLASSHHIESSSTCSPLPQANLVDQQIKSIDNKGQLNLLVWNIYKQNRANWQTGLSVLAQDKQLILLQETRMTPDFSNWLNEEQRVSYQVEAFKAFGIANGVVNLSSNPARKVCALTQLEPWIRLPKSALYALYPLSTGVSLAVVNIHAINFSYGTQEYQQQLNAIAKLLERHQGPMIVAGDFNSWSKARLSLVVQMVSRLGLREVKYQQDNRSKFITGLPLDHVFYRGLLAEKAEAPLSDASDHNPILVRFRLMPSSNSQD